MRRIHPPMIIGCLLLFVASTYVYAQSTFVYTNNDSWGSNSVSAFSVGSGGALTPVVGSPFLTGGEGWGGGLAATSRVAVTVPGNFLYAANDYSNSISGFSIDAVTGRLKPVSGSPFLLGTSPDQISLAASPDGQFLYAGSFTSTNISAFSIASNGALTPVPGSPFPSINVPINMKIFPDGKFLASAEGGSGVEMFSIAPNGRLTPVPGSPFSLYNFPGALDVNCASNLLFAATPVQGMNVLNIASNGVLTPVAGSPFTFTATSYLMPVLSPDDQHLFVSDFTNSTITSLNVASGGSLTEVTGSPFPTGSYSAQTLATNAAGTLLYVAARWIVGFNIDGNGALTLVPGSPFNPGAEGSPSLAIFPPKTCLLTVGLEIKPPASPPAPINPSAKGKIPVAILSTLTFNAVTQIDTDSLTFGHSGTEASLSFCGGGEDVNGDGLVDLVCHFNMPRTGFVAGDTTAFLKGQTVNARKIQGSEAIRTVPR